MNVQSTIEVIERFASRSSPFGELEVEISEPWHFSDCKGTKIPFQNAGKGGSTCLPNREARGNVPQLLILSPYGMLELSMTKRQELRTYQGLNIIGGRILKVLTNQYVIISLRVT